MKQALIFSICLLILIGVLFWTSKNVTLDSQSLDKSANEKYGFAIHNEASFDNNSPDGDSIDSISLEEKLTYDDTATANSSKKMPDIHDKNNYPQFELSFHKSFRVSRYEGKRTTQENLLSVINGGASSYRLMEFSRGIGALLAMFEATDSIMYMEEILDLSENLLSKARPGKLIENNPAHYKDDYLGWANINRTDHPNLGRHLEEYPLYESYLFRYLAKAVYLIKNSKTAQKNSSLLARSQKILDFIETNGWEKWKVRGDKVSPNCYKFLFRGRTHMASHWAMVALYLRELTTSGSKKEEYTKFLNLYNQQLRLNFRVTPENAYVWNMTWDTNWPTGTNCNAPDKEPIIQDASHGNHVVTYIIESFEMGSGFWAERDIQRLCNTAKFLLFDSSNQRFYGDLNQKFISNMSNGIRLSDGFVKLSRYDEKLFDIINNVTAMSYKSSDFNFYEAQFVAELLLAKRKLGYGN